ncbi:MAG TPA: hypothetical protein VHN37_11580 [Actinomycetota bacterium]|nr:hypothetical protein [Actinomycetota bacterium]
MPSLGGAGAPERARLRVGVMLDSFAVPAWIEKVLRQIESSGIAELRIAILNREPPRSRSQRVRGARGRELFWLYEKVDYRVFRAAKDAFATTDVAGYFDSAEVLEVVPLRKRFVHRFDDATIATIRAHDLDVMLRFGFGIIRGDILETARCGVWSYHHGDNREYRGGPAFFWEMQEGNPVTGTMLQVLGEKLDAGRVIYRSHSATNFYSLYLSRNSAYWKSADFVVRRLRDVYERGWDGVVRDPAYDDPDTYSRGLYRPPSNRVMLAFAWRLAGRLLRRALDRAFYRAQWYVLVTDSSTRRDRPLLPPPARFYADPFVLDADGGRYVLFEDFSFADRKGRISYVAADDEAATARPALERDYHLSYPFVFRWDGATYMVPETSAAGRIELYRAERVPDRWRLERTLIDGLDAVDATVLEHGGRFWLFAGVAVEGANYTDELFLFSADTPVGPWAPHPANPVVSDVRRARPAGRIRVVDGVLVRPSQDCSRSYGGEIVLNRIDRLDEDAYAETPIGRIGVERVPGAAAIHHVDEAGGVEVLDALRRIPKLSLRR